MQPLHDRFYVKDDFNASSFPLLYAFEQHLTWFCMMCCAEMFLPKWKLSPMLSYRIWTTMSGCARGASAIFVQVRRALQSSVYFRLSSKFFTKNSVETTQRLNQPTLYIIQSPVLWIFSGENCLFQRFPIRSPVCNPPPATIASLLRKRHKHRRKIPETSVRFTLREYETKFRGEFVSSQLCNMLM